MSVSEAEGSFVVWCFSVTNHTFKAEFLSWQEAYPPKLAQMAYITAETYYEEEILQMELIILKVSLI